MVEPAELHPQNGSPRDVGGSPLASAMKILALLACCVLPLAAAEKPKAYYYPDVQHLITIRHFAFGPTGFTREMSEGERAFSTIVKKKDAIRCMLAVFDHGTPEAQCYALVALREFSSELFAQSVATFQTNPPENIRTLDGAAESAIPSA
jgi:hypothetical protein